MKFRVGTRDSQLALEQTNIVCQELIAQDPGLNISQFEVVKIKTLGDKLFNKNLAEIGGKNLFVNEIEEALLNKQIDFAVHSLKDMTAKLDERLVIAACLEREDPRDAFVSHEYKNLDDLPIQSLIGTSSIRRKFMALNKRSDLITVPFRGNVLTRLEKLKQRRVDATFLAVAGLKRLKIDKSLYNPISIDDFLPAISQGVIGVECLSENKSIIELLRTINHRDTEICTEAERGFLTKIDGNCSLPIAAYAVLEGDKINLKCLVINSQGKIFKTNVIGDKNFAENVGYLAGIDLHKHL